MASSLPSERSAIVATLDPDAYAAAGTFTSDWASVADFPQMLATISMGDTVTGSVINFKLQQATNSSGTGAKDITGKAISALTMGSGAEDAQAEINVEQDELDVANDFTHVAMVLEPTVQIAECGAVLRGFRPTYAPASDSDLASVVEIVT